MSVTKGLGLAGRGVAVAVEAAMATLLAAMVLLVGAETVAWSLFGLSLPQAEEIESLLLVWFGLLGAAWGVRAGVHLAVEIVVRRLPTGLRRFLGRLEALMLALFGVLLLRYGVALVGAVTNTLPATGWSASVGYVPAVVAGGLILFFALERLFAPGLPGASRDG